MRKTKLQSGDILRITLPKALGFAYAKYIDLLEIDPVHRYPNLLRIYNYKSVTPIVDVSILEKCGLLFSPLIVAGIPESIKEGSWKVIGTVSVTSEEKIIPQYKLCEPSEPPILLEEEKARNWFYVIDADKFSKKVNRHIIMLSI